MIIQRVFRISFLTVSLFVLGSCGGGGGGGTEVPFNPPASFKVQQFFKNIREQGARYTMTGEFTDGSDGSKTQERHENESIPIEAVAGSWRDFSNVQRRQVRVSRFSDGVAGAQDLYNSYFDGDFEVGSQVDGGTDYVLNDPHVSRPVSAQIGDTGAGPEARKIRPDGSVVDRFIRWEMKQDDNQQPQYCETRVESENGNWIWDQTWCYSLFEDGTPRGQVSYAYDAGNGYVGQISDDNIRYPYAGTAPPGADTRVTSYRVAEYFRKLKVDGARYTLIGTFTDGAGATTQQEHDQIRFPAQDYGTFNWPMLQVYQETDRQQVRVDRTVDGEPGRSDTYYRYYESNGRHLATQTDGEQELRLTELYPNRPVSAQIGDTGSGPDSLLINESGQPFAKRTLSKWEMKTNAAGQALYCETIDQTDLTDNQQWQFTWCYSMKPDGTPDSYISFSFDSGGGSVGSLVANNMGPFEVPPPPEVCVVNCESQENGGGF